MLKSTYVVTTPSVKHLLKLWGLRYKTDSSSLLLSQEPSIDSFLQTALPEGRVRTAEKLKEKLLNINSQMAWIQTKSLYNYLPNVFDFNEAKKITESAFIVYKTLLSIYEKQLLREDSFTIKLLQIAKKIDHTSVDEFKIITVEELAYALEPILMEFQEQQIACKDWRTLGFMTTQLKFTNKLILNQVTQVEKLLLSPYLKFVEEQIAIPWQRVCIAGANHSLDSPTLALVEQMFPLAEEIAQTVYHRIVELFPEHRSRSGFVNNPNVAQSSIRDLNMFQAYLWLCVLEESLVSVEKELVNLCFMVMEKAEVKWGVLQKWNQLLMDEVISRVNPEHKAILLPYTQGMQKAFAFD
jgi:hypothetical protein